MLRQYVLVIVVALLFPSLEGASCYGTDDDGATKVFHKTAKVGDLEIFYREAGAESAPKVLLLHGFPTSSQMFRNLIPLLARDFHVYAPDYPEFGHSSMPSREKFTYSFDSLPRIVDEFATTLGIDRYAMYVQDYGAPIPAADT